MQSLKCLSGVTNLGQKLLISSTRNIPNISRLRNVSSCCFKRTVLLQASAASTSRTTDAFPSASVPLEPPFSGLEDVLLSYIFGNKKATEVAHLYKLDQVLMNLYPHQIYQFIKDPRQVLSVGVWDHVVRKGDTVIDATCGNGYDTLAMLKMVADESGRGRVYGFDVQKEALGNASSLLEESVNPTEKELVKLFLRCHSKMAEVLPEDTSARLVAFNLGYLPGGDKTIITESQTTAEALNVAMEILMPGGLISLVVYVGHPGGREELETVEEFSTKLPVEKWSCCKIQMLNRQLAPILVFLFKKC